MVKSVRRTAASAVRGCALGITAAMLPQGSGASASASASAGASASASGTSAAPTASGPGSAAPARRTGWRVTKVIPVSGDTVVMTGIDALSADDAWVAAVAIPLSNAAARPLLEHWTGTTWRPVPLPAHLAAGLLEESAWASVGASSPGDVWAFGAPAQNRKQGTSELASHWNGRSWTAASLRTAPADTDDALSSLVPDRTSPWALGDRRSFSQGLIIVRGPLPR
jgi:hypothetical protein